MKKLTFLIILCIAISSCKKDSNSQQNVDLQEYNSKLKGNTKNLGISHNDGISYSINSNQLSTGFLFPPKTNPDPLSSAPNYTSQDLKDIIISTYDFIGSTYGEEYRGIPSQILPTVVDVINAPNTVLVNAKIDSIENILTQNSILTAREALMIQELQNIFTVGSQLNMTSLQAGPYFANKLETLRTKYENIVWNINEGEAFLGMLSIAESSNEYWHLGTTLQLPPTQQTGNSAKFNKKMNVTVIPALDPFEPEGSIVHVDLAGYALGWGWAVYNDWAAGNLHESGQNGRITRGLQTAITASALRLAKRELGDGVSLSNDLFIDSPKTSTPVLHFPANYFGRYYYVSSEDLAHDGNLMYPTFVYLGTSNKYYYNSGLTCLLPDGIYFSKTSTAYYKVENGVVTKEGIKPTSFPGGLKPFQHVIDNLFPPCN
ncbi:hypothetical protein [Sphingobacterium detergens]